MKHCEVFLVGGVFKGIHADLYLNQLLFSEALSDAARELQPLIKNMSKNNPALLAGRRIIERNQEGGIHERMPRKIN